MFACFRVPSSLLLPLLFALAPVRAAEHTPEMDSVFFPEQVTAALRAQLAANPIARRQADQAIATAQAWRDRSDEELWSAMFGPTIKRSWMVWSNGHCPACKGDVPMYTWKVDALRTPWKVTCPHCAEQFPKNDFAAFHRSGLDVHGVFDPARADRSLLFNPAHPSPDDPRHRFGVDDGTGYFDGTNRWYFIGAYLIRGQWKQYVLEGVRSLAMAYVLTGEPVYAHKAAILLDRVADVYGTFDFLTQGLSYEKADPIAGAGMVSVWHDACRETLELILAYDMIAPAIARDPDLVRFLAAQAARHQLPNPKDTPERIRAHIEDGILREVLRRPDKILSNFPNTEITLLTARAVLGWPGNRDEILAELQAMLEKATAVDGLTGEKGLGGYSAIAPRTTSDALCLFGRLDSDLLPTLVRRVPAVANLYRFHADTWIGGTFYPKVGDTGTFGRKDPHYIGAQFGRDPFDPLRGGIPLTSDFTLFWQLYRITGDPTFVQLLYQANNHRVDGLPYDPFDGDPAKFQRGVADVIRQHGAAPAAGSVNKEQWALAILTSGQGESTRALWLDYDVGGNHGRPDAMAIGIYAKCIELLPGFGYPPVHFGGWYSPRALWYKRTAAHNTVVVDGHDQTPIRSTPETEPLAIQLNPQKGLVRGTTTAWAVGRQVKLARVTGPHLVQTAKLELFERSLLLVDISTDDSYVLDVFRVAGGRDHAKLLHGNIGTATVTGLGNEPQPGFGPEVQMRNFRGGRPAAGWSVDWQIEDRLKTLPPGANVHLRYTDLTTDAQAAMAESWLAYHDHGANHEVWLPSLVVRRQAKTEPLASTFVGVLEPYSGKSNLGAIRRLGLQTSAGIAAGDNQVAVAVALADGRTDLLIATAAPASGPRPTVTQPDWACTTDADFCLIRRDATGKIVHVFFHGGTFVQCGDQRFTHAPGALWTEL